MLLGVTGAVGAGDGTVTVDEGVGWMVATADGDDCVAAGVCGGGDEELGSLFVVEVAVSSSTALRFGEGLRG